MEYYWEIVRYGNEPSIFIRPDFAETVKKRWNDGQPIHTQEYGSIAANQIKEFRISTKRYGQQALLEDPSQRIDAAQVETGTGPIKARWVKKPVSNAMYIKHYGAIPGYRKLEEDGSMTWIAFRLPVHRMNETDAILCTESDIRRLTA